MLGELLGCSAALRTWRYNNGKRIPITKNNATVYDTWVCWCREIARVGNETPESPRHDLRAVDVERALFILATGNRRCPSASGRPSRLDVRSE